MFRKIITTEKQAIYFNTMLISLTFVRDNNDNLKILTRRLELKISST